MVELIEESSLCWHCRSTELRNLLNQLTESAKNKNFEWLIQIWELTRVETSIMVDSWTDNNESLVLDQRHFKSLKSWSTESANYDNLLQINSTDN